MNFTKALKVFLITGKYLGRSFKNLVTADELKAAWSKEILLHFNLKVEVKGGPDRTSTPCILVGNHISYLDIPVLMNHVPEISFVSKKEVKFWPLIGKAAEKVKTIFVDRGNEKSREAAKGQIARVLIEENKKVAIFPSGTTAIRRSSFWKKGAFEIAEKNKIAVQPFRFRYEPLSAAAYVGRDNFFLHMIQLFRHREIKVVLEFHEPVFINNSVTDCQLWKEWCESLF